MSDGSRLLTIGEVAQKAGLRPSALRFYENEGILPPPERHSGKRRYDPSILYLLEAIKLAREAGFTVGEIRDVFCTFDEDVPPSARWRALAVEKLAEVEESIRRAQAMKALLEEGCVVGA